MVYGGYKIYENKDYISQYIKMGRDNVNFIRKNNIPTSIGELTPDIKDAYESIKFDDYAPDVFDPEQVKLLTDDEIKSIRAYTTPLYKQANAVLRGDGEGTDVGKIIAKNVSNALNKVSISKDVNIQRGINQSVSRKIIGINNLTELLNIRNISENNTEIKTLDSLKNVFSYDSGIMSTAIPYTNSRGKSTSIADYFSGKDGIIFDLKAKEGLKGMYISPISEQKSEREIIFAPNSAIKLTGEYQIIDGIIHVFGNLVQ